MRRIVFCLLVLFWCSGCSLDPFGSRWKSYVPDEFKSICKPKIVYVADGTHAFGPAGINDAFIVYDICNDLLEKINGLGLGYLHSIQSKTYKDWQATPFADEERRWVRHFNMHNDFRKYFCQGISVCSFYGDNTAIPPYLKNDESFKGKTLEDLNFTDEIKSDYLKMANEAINSPGGYYGYGEFGIFIISPVNRKMIFLYRDSFPWQAK